MSSSRPDALVLSFSDLKRDPRVRRQLRILKEFCRVSAIGLGDPEMPGVDFRSAASEGLGSNISSPPTIVSMIRRRITGKCRQVGELLALQARDLDAFYWHQRVVKRSLAVSSGIRADVVIANDAMALPVALKIAAGAPVLFDAHEYAPREYEESFAWRVGARKLVMHILRTYARRAAAITVVCEQFVAEYEREFGVKSQVVTNATAFADLVPVETRPDRLRLVHHGGAWHSRYLDRLVTMVRYLDTRFELDFFVVGHAADITSLKAAAAGQSRIRFRDPVPVSEIVRTIHGYDIGVHLLPPTNFNNLHALPNKFFEYIQARLAVAIGPSPQMAKIVRQFDCGVVSHDFTPAALASRLNALSNEDVDRMKSGSHRAAQVHNEAATSKIFTSVVDGLLGRSRT